MYAVCKVLDINAVRNMWRWRTLLLWMNARTLLCTTVRGNAW